MTQTMTDKIQAVQRLTDNQAAKKYDAAKILIEQKLGPFAMRRLQDKITDDVIHRVIAIDAEHGYIDAIDIANLCEQLTEAKAIAGERLQDDHVAVEIVQFHVAASEMQEQAPQAPPVPVAEVKEPAPYARMLSSSAGLYPVAVKTGMTMIAANDEAFEPKRNIRDELQIPYSVTGQGVTQGVTKVVAAKIGFMQAPSYAFAAA
jgi:hypothetical protein